LRMRLPPQLPFAALLAQVRQTALAAYQHQDVPFERLVEELVPQRRLNTPPLLQVTLAVPNVPAQPSILEGVTVEPAGRPAPTVRFDLEVHATERAGALDLLWVYNRD